MIFAGLSYLLLTVGLYTYCHWHLKRNNTGTDFLADAQLSQKLCAFCSSTLLSGIFFSSFVLFLDFSPYIHFDWSLSLGLQASSYYFIVVLSIILFLTKDSKKLPKFWKFSPIIIAVGCLAVGNLTIYFGNTGLDTSNVVSSVEKIRIEAKDGRKGSTDYYLRIDKANHPNFKPNHNDKHYSQRITRGQKDLLIGKEEARFFIRQGYFDMPYFWIDESYNATEKK